MLSPTNNPLHFTELTTTIALHSRATTNVQKEDDEGDKSNNDRLHNVLVQHLQEDSTAVNRLLRAVGTRLRNSLVSAALHVVL